MLGLLDLSSGQDKQITSSVDRLPALVWNSSSSAAAYTLPAEDGATALAVIEIDTLKPHIVLTSSSNLLWPVGWSRFGDEIFYYTILDGSQQIRAVSVLGQDRPIVSLGSTDDVTAVRNFELSHDGQQLICQIFGTGGAHVLLIDLKKQASQEVITSDSEVFGLRWKHDNSLAYSIPSSNGQSSASSTRLTGPLSTLRLRKQPQLPLRDGDLQLLVSESTDGGYQVVRSITHEDGVVTDHYGITGPATTSPTWLGDTNSIDILGWQPAPNENASR